MHDTLTELYTASIDDELSNLQRIISGGTCSDFADYRHRVGIMKGLEISKRIIEHELEKVANLQNTD